MARRPSRTSATVACTSEREGSLRQITQDHSWVSEQVRAGVMTEKDARRHPWRNVVTRALAGGDDPEVDVADIDVRGGRPPAPLLGRPARGRACRTSSRRSSRRASRSATPARLLIDAANAAGGPDNITVVLLQVDVA